jgi:Tol biopolymer transport system component
MMKRALVVGLIALVIGTGTQIELIELINKIREISSISSISVPLPVRLTTGGCCTLPFWSPDGKEIRFIDRPQGGKLGIYAVSPEKAGAAPVLVSERVEDSRIVGPYRVETTQNSTTLIRLSDGKAFKAPAQGRNVQFSPDFTRIAWSISNENANPEQQVAAIWTANVDGSNPKRVAQLRRGGVGGWISDGELLVNGQENKTGGEQILWALNLADGKLRELARAERLRSAILSPSGRWVAFYTTFAEEGRNGLWIADTQGGKPRLLPKEAFGAYQWRVTDDGDRLVIVPFRPNAQVHEFWQLEPETLAFEPLTRGDETPVKIANGDWRVSPDGKRVAYVESADRNIWVVELP